MPAALDPPGSKTGPQYRRFTFTFWTSTAVALLRHAFEKSGHTSFEQSIAALSFAAGAAAGAIRSQWRTDLRPDATSNLMWSSANLSIYRPPYPARSSTIISAFELHRFAASTLRTLGMSARRLGVMRSNPRGPRPGPSPGRARLKQPRPALAAYDRLWSQIGSASSPASRGARRRPSSTCGDGPFEEAQRRLIGLQLPRHRPYLTSPIQPASPLDRRYAWATATEAPSPLGTTMAKPPFEGTPFRRPLLPSQQWRTI